MAECVSERTRERCPSRRAVVADGPPGARVGCVHWL